MTAPAMDEDDNDLEQEEEASDYDYDENSREGEGESGQEDAEGSSDDEEEEDDDEEDDDDEDEEEDEDEEAMDVDDNESRADEGSYRRSISPTTYRDKAELRRSRIKPSQDMLEASAYSIEPAAALPHASHIHAMALSADGTALLTGGSDGHIRRYDVYATMNGKNMLTNNIRHGFAEGITKGGTLLSYWGNEERLTVKDEDRDGYYEKPVSAVHSLVIQKDALWSMSGTASGNINLTTVRHDPGTTHHVLRKHKGPVSALALANDDTELVSGGWDKGVHQWDLNTGQVVRSFPGHAGQISSLSFRPLNAGETASRSNTPRSSPAVSISYSQRGGSAGRRGRSTASKSPVKDRQAAGPSSPSKTKTGDEGATQTQAPSTTDNPASPSATSAPFPPPDDGLGTPSAGFEDGDRPGMTDEDLEFEAELQKSLGVQNSSQQDEPSLKLSNGSKTGSSIQPPTLGGRTGLDDDEKGSAGQDDDSLFGSGDEDMEDAVGSADIDADGEEDAEGEEDEEDPDDSREDDDQPLSGLKKNDTAGVDLPGLIGGGASSLGLPQGGSSKLSTPTTANGSSSLGSSQRLKSTASTSSSFDSPTSSFSNDLLLTTTLSGQAILWDRRIPSLKTGVRSIPIPGKTPPWCSSAAWAPDGERIYIGRRNESVEEWDMRMISSGKDVGYSSAWYGRRKDIGLLRTLKFPNGSGPVSSLKMMPNGKHLVCASFDNIRLWNLSTPSSSTAIPFRIVPGHHGGTISALLLDPTSRFLFSSSGDRGWLSPSTETVLISEVVGSR